jgi:hypothetical protein
VAATASGTVDDDTSATGRRDLLIGVVVSFSALLLVGGYLSARGSAANWRRHDCSRTSWPRRTSFERLWRRGCS